MYMPKGVIASMVTSFDCKGGVDTVAMQANVAFHRKAGSRSVMVLGGTGEPVSMAAAERQAVLEASVAAAGGDIDVLSAALVGNPDDVARDIAMAARCGAKACMVTTPPFVRPSESDVYRFLTEIARRSALPLIIFNVPSRTGFLMSAALVERVARDIDLLVGIKESSRDIALFGEIRRRTEASFACLQGVDGFYLASLALGADGGILAAAAVFPEILNAMEHAFRQGDAQAARRWNDVLAPLLPLLYEASHPAPLKRALEARGLPVGKTRPPLYEISDDLGDRVVRQTCQLGELLQAQGA